jgi:ankyrin repeat protein
MFTDPHHCDEQGWTLLMDAALINAVDIARELIEVHHVNVHAGTSGGPLYCAVLGEASYEMFMLLVTNGCRLDCRGTNGDTLLHNLAGTPALSLDQTQILAYLLEHGADVNAMTWGHVSVLLEAVSANNLTTVKLLLRHGANPNTQTLMGGGVLAVAAVCFSIDICKILLMHGADVHQKVDGRSILSFVIGRHDTWDTVRGYGLGYDMKQPRIVGRLLLQTLADLFVDWGADTHDIPDRLAFDDNAETCTETGTIW